MWLSLSLRRRRDLSFNRRCFIGDASPEFNPTSVILCLSLKPAASSRGSVEIPDSTGSRISFSTDVREPPKVDDL